jgi:hypothetical protein
MTTTTTIVDFLNSVTAALGITATVDVKETADGPRFNLTGEEAELPCVAASRSRRYSTSSTCPTDGRSRAKRVFALEYARKDIEMRNMASFLPAR